MDLLGVQTSVGYRWALLGVVVMTGCSVPGMPEEKRYPLSALEQKMATCPQGMSEEAAAGACLSGTYDGKTPSMDACSLTVGENALYQFSSPTLQITHPTTAGTRFSFHYFADEDHGYDLISWNVNDPVDINVAFYDLRFKADFGTLRDDAESQIEIEVQKTDVSQPANDRDITCRLTP